MRPRWSVLPICVSFAAVALWAAAQPPVNTPPEGAPEGPPAVTLEVTQEPAPAAESLASTGTLRMLRTLETFHKDVRSIHATFQQVREDEVFLEKIESAGELWFIKPDRFRVNYADPEPMVTLIVENALYLYVPELEQVEVWTFRSEEERNQQLHMLLIAFGFKTEELVRRYEIHSSEDEAEPRTALEEREIDPTRKVLFTIKPRPAFLETSPFSLLEVTIDKSSLLPEKIWYRDQTDSTMTLNMSKIERDVSIDEDLFAPSKVIPRGTEYIYKREDE